jgi:uncharacterized membrane-anchored protein
MIRRCYAEVEGFELTQREYDYMVSAAKLFCNTAKATKTSAKSIINDYIEQHSKASSVKAGISAQILEQLQA